MRDREGCTAPVTTHLWLPSQYTHTHTHKETVKNLFSKKKKKDVHTEMDSMVSYPKNQAVHILPIPSRTV